jgi:N-acetyl-gamma-glutamyl-phosphate reductase
MERLSLGLIGARGHVGAELLAMIRHHPRLSLAFAVSREWAGRPVEGFAEDLRFEALSPEEAAERAAEVVVLALPNGQASPWLQALAAQPPRLLLDLSADHRFAADWTYGLPELTRRALAGARRIANPGCYATAMLLALHPFRELLAGPVQCFGVSGYSGAGTTPSPRNDPELLGDNLMPYQLTGHLHEREVSHHLGHPVQFFPHVAPFFRGISLTANLMLRQPISLAEATARLEAAYRGEPLIELHGAAIPWIRQVVGRPKAAIGGLTLTEGGERLVVVSVLDNLLKGAASQAIQNLNVALGWPETLGLAEEGA